MNEGGMCWCTWHAYVDTFEMTWHVCGVGATFEGVKRRAWGECNVSRQREQGNRWIWEYQQGRVTWEFTEKLWSIVERCLQTDELDEQSYMALKVPTGKLLLPPYVRSFPERPDAKLKLWARLRRSYKAGLRCWSAYLGWRELSAAAGQLGLEGHIGEISRWSKITNTATGIVISSANRLVMSGRRLQIQ